MSDIIELKNICKSYDGKKLFDDFCLTIEQVDYIEITGKSGAGKSTLLNIIGLLESTDSGDYSIFGIKNPEIGSKDGVWLLRYKLGYLFQNFGLVDNQTVEYNLKLASKFKKWTKEFEKDKFKEVLDTVGLSGIEKKKIYQLSGGEQQRIAVAKLMLKSPDVILADEPTGSLDAANRDIIMNLIEKMHRDGKTIVLVTHDEKVKLCAEKELKL